MSFGNSSTYDPKTIFRPSQSLNLYLRTYPITHCSERSSSPGISGTESTYALALDSLDALSQFTSALIIAMVKQRYVSTKDPFLGSPDVYYESTDEWILHSASPLKR
jgi:hypothetical protein